MQNINSIEDLKDAIQMLEAEQAAKWRELKEQSLLTYASVKPFNLLKNALFNVSSTPNLVNNILGTAVGIGTGYLSKKIIIGTSGNILRRILGTILQMGITNVAVKHPNEIKSLSQYIFEHIFHKKELKSENSDS